ncbi:MAG: protein phosphatase 2C domain-containing protein [Bacteroidota bacterium]|jgi:serine/threonine protein phosphatase PrpC
MTYIELPEIESHCLTHIGNVRQDNQDSVRIIDQHDDLTASYGHLFGVADGMGGYAHGGVASTLALVTLFETVYSSDGLSIPQKMKQAVQSANLNVYQKARELGVGRMGTTLTAGLLKGNTFHIAHVGDSRAYLIRGKTSTCLTKDHTRVGELVRMKVLSPDKVRTHNQRSVLSKCLGLDLFVQPDVFEVKVQDGDIIIFCSDGVWSVINDDEFGTLASKAVSAEQLNQTIVDLAMKRGSDDNVSAVTIILHKLVARQTKHGSRFSKIIKRFAGRS